MVFTEKSELEPNQELVVELPTNQGCSITLLSGRAELFGFVLQLNKETFVPLFRFSLFAVEKSTLRLVCSDPPFLFTNDATTTPSQLRLFLDALANRASRVVVVGAAFSGKDKLCHTFLNWHLRTAARPVFVDLDTECNSLVLPGFVAAHQVDSLFLSLETLLLTSVPNTLVFAVGSRRAADDFQDFETALEKLVWRLPTAVPCVVNLGTAFNKRPELLAAVLRRVQATDLVVVGNERLFHQLRKALVPSVHIHRLAKPMGVPESNEEELPVFSVQVKNYFYGAAVDRASLSPTAFDLPVSELAVFRNKLSREAAASLVPLYNHMGSRDSLEAVDLDQRLVGAVFAVGSTRKPEDLFDEPVVGFVQVQAVDTEAKKVTLLRCTADPAPSHTLLFVN